MTPDYREGYRRGWLDAIKHAETVVGMARFALVEKWFDQTMEWQAQDRDDQTAFNKKLDNLPPDIWP